MDTVPDMSSEVRTYRVSVRGEFRDVAPAQREQLLAAGLGFAHLRATASCLDDVKVKRKTR